MKRLPPARLSTALAPILSRALVCQATLMIGAVSTIGAYELPRDLRREVNRLIAEVKEAPTALQTANARMAVLWKWANAASLQGAFIPKNLSLAAHYVPHPTPGTPTSPRYLASIDNYVRQLAMLDQDPNALGSVSVEPEIVATPRSWQEIVVRFEIGSKGVREGGGFLVSRHIMGGYDRFQVTDPAGDNYLSIRASRSGITFDLDEAPVSGPYGGFRAPVLFPVFRARGGSLRANDIVTLTYGDRSGGGRGLRVGSFSNTAIALPLHLDPGDGSFYEMPPAIYQVKGGLAAGVHGFAPSIVRTGESITVSVRTEDRFYNRATSEIPAYQVLLNGEPFSTLPAGQAIHRLEASFDRPGVYRLTFLGNGGRDTGGSADGRIEGAANPIWVRDDAAYRIYWGETHGHCGFAEGQGTPEGYFEFARDDARLDFVTLSEHDIWLTDGKWRYLNEAVTKFHREGELAVFAGYEWSSQRQRGGHHNVFLRRAGMDRVGVQEAPNLADLYRGLRAKHDPRDVLIIPHAHQAGDWRLSDLDMESLIEIMSSHGTFEWFGQRYLENGYRVGFVGASDDHIGHPGYAPGHPASRRRRSNIFQFGGLAAALTSEDSSDAIFDALKAKSTYATTGSQRIILDARLNGHPIGTSQQHSPERNIEGRAIGTAPIRRIDLVKNNEVVQTFDLDPPHRSTDASGNSGIANEVVVSFHSDSEVFFRDNPRGHRTWRGILVIENSHVLEARLLGTPNTTSDRLEVEGDRISFDVATRGASRSFLIELDRLRPVTRFRFQLEQTREMGTAPLQRRRPQNFAAERFSLALLEGETESEKILQVGRYRDRVSVERPRTRDDVEFRFSDSGLPGDWYYVRVEQIDGHLAWSSPWWVGGEPPR